MKLQKDDSATCAQLAGCGCILLAICLPSLIREEVLRHGFVAFVDESGQEGGVGKAGSSDYFVISAVICRRDRSSPIGDAFTRAAKALGKGPNWRFEKFSKETKPNTRFVIVNEIANSQCQIATVICRKDLFKKSTMTDSPAKLYFYASHLLAERISWICRDAHQKTPSSDGRVFIIFSQRTSLNYKMFQEYSKDIKSGAGQVTSKAEWKHLDLDAITHRPHASRCQGLLAADYVASAFGSALERNKYGLSDDRYVRCLSKITYKSSISGRHYGNGLKFFPREAEVLPEKDIRLWWAKCCFR